jgi:hypothetical protein
VIALALFILAPPLIAAALAFLIARPLTWLIWHLIKPRR